VASAERFFGALGIWRYPFDRFMYVQAQLKLGGVDFVLDRTTEQLLRDFPGNGIGQNGLEVWEQVNHGVRFQTHATLSVGYDTIRYHPGTGPLSGRSIL